MVLPIGREAIKRAVALCSKMVAETPRTASMRAFNLMIIGRHAAGEDHARSSEPAGWLPWRLRGVHVHQLSDLLAGDVVVYSGRSYRLVGDDLVME